LPHIARELIPGQPLPDDLAHYDIEAVAVVHLAIVVAEDLLIEVAEQWNGSTLI
jgi:hypothetical protein